MNCPYIFLGINYKSPLLADNKKIMTGPEITINAKQVNWKINWKLILENREVTKSIAVFLKCD